MVNKFSRRAFLATASAYGAASLLPVAEALDHNENTLTPASSNKVSVPDTDWNLWLDIDAKWQDDQIFLPGEFDQSKLPANSPSGGWSALYGRQSGEHFKSVKLPTTVEQHFWGVKGTRPYTPDEYRYAADDQVPQNGAYEGVSWFWRTIEIPAAMAGKRILLDVRGARMRAEVFLNEILVGYSIMEELPFTCDLTLAVKPGGTNHLAIRITNPGGRYDWVDGGTIRWGSVNVYRSHGFGGLDRGLTLRSVPKENHIEDFWVLNTPEPRTVVAKVKFSNSHNAPVHFDVIHPATGKVIAKATGTQVENAADGAHASAILHVPDAKLWDLKTPELYTLRATLENSTGPTEVREVTFGFRWFAPDGIGTNALFRLNGRRIKIYTSISWGFWGHNGLFPTPELAEREVLQAKRLNLNCLNFHRNVGKEEVFQAHDRLGLLRYMEPGGGKLSIGRVPDGAALNAAGTVMQASRSKADQFSRRFMLEKCRAMVRAYRSHPSLIQYTLQNELGANLNNPTSLEGINIMHAEDASRIVVMNDGFVARGAAQAWYAPYNDEMYRSDKQPWGRWWINHQGAGDQWYDGFYKDPEHFTYYQPMKDALVEFGEMEGCAVADNHPLMIQQIKTKAFGGNGSSYDLKDHEEIAGAYERYFDRWGFRKAFPSSEKFYRSLGNKCYKSWQQYLENIRICDDVDFAAISGWESTAIENHSGIVDNLRNFKGDPDFIASSLLPIRPVLKQHALCYASASKAVFDVFLLNDTGSMPSGNLRLEMVDPNKNKKNLASWTIPQAKPDQFSYTVATGFESPELTVPGIYRFQLACDGAASATCIREIWVIDKSPLIGPKIKVAVSGLTPELKKQLENAADITVLPFVAGLACDVIVASGVLPGSLLDRQVGEETGLEAPPDKNAVKEKQIPGRLSDDLIAAVKAGTPLLVAVPDDDLADGIARQLAAQGAFSYEGQVGDTRAPWMGNWLFVKDHVTFGGMPTDRVLGVHYQANGKQANGLVIERAKGGTEPTVIMGYSRDHDRKIGAASFLCAVGKTPVLFHRAPPFSDPLQERWLRNALRYLTSKEARS